LYLLLPPTTTETGADAEVAVATSASSRVALHLKYVLPDLLKIVFYSLALEHFATFHSLHTRAGGAFYFFAGLQVALVGNFTEDFGGDSRTVVNL